MYYNYDSSRECCTSRSALLLLQSLVLQCTTFASCKCDCAQQNLDAQARLTISVHAEVYRSDHCVLLINHGHQQQQQQQEQQRQTVHSKIIHLSICASVRIQLK